MPCDLECRSTLTKLSLAADYFAAVNPQLAAYYMNEAENLKSATGVQPTSSSLVCPRCCLVRRPDNCHVEVCPRMKITKRMQRALKQKSQGRRLGRHLEHCVRSCSHGYNRTKLRCSVCGHTATMNAAPRPLKVDLKISINQKLTRSQKKKIKHRAIAASGDGGLDRSGLTFSLTPATLTSTPKISSTDGASKPTHQGESPVPLSFGVYLQQQHNAPSPQTASTVQAPPVLSIDTLSRARVTKQHVPIKKDAVTRPNLLSPAAASKTVKSKDKKGRKNVTRLREMLARESAEKKSQNNLQSFLSAL